MIRYMCRRTAATLALLVLGGCSALQIDVDVYKGSLTHDPAIQERQYAAMVMAAKPVLAKLRNDLEAARQLQQPASAMAPRTVRPVPRPLQCELEERAELQGFVYAERSRAGETPDGGDYPMDWGPRSEEAAIPVSELNKYSHSVMFRHEAPFYINGLLSFYENGACVHPGDDWHRARPNRGLIALFSHVIRLAGDGGAVVEERRRAVAELTDSLIPFAERILFVVNQSSYLDRRVYTEQHALLQTLGNSLILHANDLRRREVHDADQRHRFQAHAAAVKSAGTSSGFGFDASRYGSDPGQAPATSMQILDDLIAHLRTQRVAMLAQGKATEAGQLAEAIEAAEQQRSDQVFLRPSADYLRNVYANTANQADERAPERNMLFDYLRALKPEGRYLGDTRAHLEKLYWQNINRVTTTGGARANHVIAKDDVGNWYIKTFSVDPKEVFESAKGLALFNLGTRLDTNLLQRAELRDTARNGADPAQRDAAKGELAALEARSPATLAVGGKAQKRFEARYGEETRDAALALKQRVAALPGGELKSAWSEALRPDDGAHQQLLARLQQLASTRQSGSLNESLEAMDSALKRVVDATAHPTALGKAIVGVLATLPPYRTDLETALAAQPELADAAQAPLLERLRLATRKTIDDLVRAAIQRRRASVESYQEGLGSIADALR